MRDVGDKTNPQKGDGKEQSSLDGLLEALTFLVKYTDMAQSCGYR